MNGFFSPEQLAALQKAAEVLTYVAGGALNTVVTIVGAMLFGLALGIPMACLAVYGPRWSRALVSLYVWFFRGVPILVLLFLFYFGFFTLVEETLLSVFGWKVDLSSFLAGVLVLGCASAAYQSQIFRGAILSLSVGQFRAAQALGFSRFKAIVHIVLPQALRISIPAWSNEYSILLKDSALVFVLGTQELMARAHFMASNTGVYLPLYIYVAVLYFILTYLGVWALKRLDRKTRIPGLAHEAGGPGYF